MKIVEGGEVGIHSLQWTDSYPIAVEFCGVSSFTKGKKSNLPQCLIGIPWVIRGHLECIPRISKLKLFVKDFQRGSEALDQLQVHWIASFIELLREMM